MTPDAILGIGLLFLAGRGWDPKSFVAGGRVKSLEVIMSHLRCDIMLCVVLFVGKKNEYEHDDDDANCGSRFKKASSLINRSRCLLKPNLSLEISWKDYGFPASSCLARRPGGHMMASSPRGRA